MKNKLILIIIFLTCYTISFSQEYKVTYQFDISKMEKLMKEKVPPEERSGDLILQAIPLLKNFEPILWINSKEAWFETKIRMNKDSDNNLAITVAKTLSQENNGPIYQDLQSEFSLRKIEAKGEKFLVVYPFDDFNWKISNERQTIDGIEVQKATTLIEDPENDEHVEAWFASSIPISSGPLQFGGLPGLIIKLSINTKYIITLKDIQTSSKKDKIIEKPKGTPISHKEYLKQFTELQKESPF